jgi:uncharacterized protein (DUF58 family)
VTPRFTRLTLPTVRLAALVLFLALLLGRPELGLVALPLLLKLLRVTAGEGVPDYHLAHAVSAERLFEGDELTVTVTLTARSRVCLLEVLEPLPPTVELASGRNRALVTLEPGQRGQWTYRLRFPGRGRFTLGTLHVRAWDRSGLQVLEVRHADRKPVRVYPRVFPLRRLPHPLRTQTSVGNYVAPTLGAGLEPGEIRPFAPGDQIRHVNWRASLRLGTLHVTRYHQERNADVVLMLDTLSQVGRPPETSLDLCVRVAASLARAYLARKDRVGLIEYGGVIRWVRPGSGPAQLERFLDALVAAEPVFTYVRKDLAMVPPRVLPPQALVIALSPLLDQRFIDAVGDLAARGFDLVILAVSPVDITRAMLVRSPVDELACRLWSVERRTRLAELRRRGLAILDWPPAHPLEVVLSPLGRHRRRALLVG